MNNHDKIAAARDAVIKFLTGEINPDDNPHWFDDDILLFAVDRLDQQDSEWLLAQLANRDFARDLRAWIIPMMRKHGAEAQASLDADNH
ncbi:hypothetical protein [Nocardia beijingensis]|uniref:hypothetical protein n=1 Tax=Nocardia beijingensis TaxID=95162 RepID=UPI00082F9A8F|nr:hypothetical protein [Nocardia beijingensis]MBF6076179.1 hypothetical protein [Nocardia beijingensis]